MPFILHLQRTTYEYRHKQTRFVSARQQYQRRHTTTAKAVRRALRAEGIATSSQGINNVVMTDWGLHIYYNITSLVNQTSADKKGFPWKLAENAHSKPNYAKGSCPVADGLFERSILLAVPSCLTE